MNAWPLRALFGRSAGIGAVGGLTELIRGSAMDVLVVLARLLLAGVFLVSGVGKLLDLAGSQQAMRGFGVPDPYAKPAGVALPLGELLVAVLLLSVATAAVGGLLGRPGPSLAAWISRLSTFEAVMLVVGVALVAALAGIGWLLVHLLG